MTTGNFFRLSMLYTEYVRHDQGEVVGLSGLATLVDNAPKATTQDTIARLTRKKSSGFAETWTKHEKVLTWLLVELR